MKLRAFDPNRDFEEIRDWITDERTHRMWCGNCFAFPLEKENFREALSGFMERYGDVPFLAVSDEGEAEGFISCAPDPERRECLLKFVVVKPERRGGPGDAPSGGGVCFCQHGRTSGPSERVSGKPQGQKVL